MKLALKLIALPIIAFVLGITAVGAPCYLVGGREWCGYKSEPPHTIPLFFGGVFLGFTAGGIALFWPRRKLNAP
ncbi:MAG: hypothetical protein QM817_24925 [Archangium sp.]